jgi:hypothetical protein
MSKKFFLHLLNMQQSRSPQNNMEKKSEEWQKKADTVQQYQAAATGGLVCVRRAAREININTEPMNKEGWKHESSRMLQAAHGSTRILTDVMWTQKHPASYARPK